MSYRRFLTVVDGVYKQLDACISAVDQAENGGKNPPDEIESLVSKMEEAQQLCKTVERLAEEEPDETETQAEDAAAFDEEAAAPEATETVDEDTPPADTI
jgi:hypothetical protein